MTTAERIAELEHQEHRARQEAADDLARRIAAAECARYGHIVPEGGPFADEIEITAWGQTAPIRIGPHCTRCGANLSEETA